MHGIIFRLSKMTSAICIAGSGVAGFCLRGGQIRNQGLWLFFGLLFLTMGAGVLNQLQEIDVDRKMARTKRRPLPAGEISAWCAGVICLAFLCFGLGLLFVSQEGVIGFLGILGLALYNGMYTPLKKKVSWAIFPGAFAGCIPPLMGFFAAGGIASEPMCLSLLGFSYSWQIAHFCLLVLANKTEYEKTEEKNVYQEIGFGGVGFLSIACGGICAGLVYGNVRFPSQAASGFPTVLFLCVPWLLLSCFPASGKIFPALNFFHGAFLAWNVLLAVGIFSIAQGCF